MEYINKIELQGVVGSVKAYRAGLLTQHISLCTEIVHERVEGGVWIETTWHNVLAYGSEVEVKKGDRINVVGRLRTAKYTGADGTEKMHYEVFTSRIKKIKE